MSSPSLLPESYTINPAKPPVIVIDAGLEHDGVLKKMLTSRSFEEDNHVNFKNNFTSVVFSNINKCCQRYNYRIERVNMATAKPPLSVHKGM